MLATPSLSTLRRDEETTDVRFALDDGTTLSAHRAVLAISSPVLRRAFFGPMKLPNDEPLRLPGKDAAAVQGLLSYCYGEPKVTAETAIGLLMMADEYCIDGLKALCEQWFMDNLGSYNCYGRRDETQEFTIDDPKTAELVHLAQLYRCSTLLEHLQQNLPKRLRAHLNSGDLEAARALATSHASFAPQLAAYMQEFDSGTLEVKYHDSILLKKLLVERGADTGVLGLVHYIVNGSAAEVEECLNAGAEPDGLNYIAYHMNMSGRGEAGEWLAKARLLLDRGAEHKRGSIGSGDPRTTPLHMRARWCKYVGKRARNGYGERVKETGALDLALLLAEYGAPLDLRDGDGKLYYEDSRDEGTWNEKWKEGMRPSEVKKAVEEAAEKGKRKLQAPPEASTAAEQPPITKAEGKKRKRRPGP